METDISEDGFLELKGSEQTLFKLKSKPYILKQTTFEAWVLETVQVGE